MINSIDVKTMLPRTAEAADLQGRETSQSQHAAEQPAVQFQQQVQREANQTVETQKSETEEYDTDDAGGGRGASAQSRNRKKKQKKDEAPMAPRSDSSFDIFI